jgi:hypothetical protein
MLVTELRLQAEDDSAATMLERRPGAVVVTPYSQRTSWEKPDA